MKKFVNRKLNPNSGFSTIELIVVLAIIGLLSSGLIFYNRTSERQIILLREQGKILSVLFKARSLSLANYGEAGDFPCDYGVHFEKAGGKIIIFREIPRDNSCSGIDYLYKEERFRRDEKIQELAIDKTAQFASEFEKLDIVFIPPRPDVSIKKEINGQISDLNEIILKIETSDKKASYQIKVNIEGLITTVLPQKSQ